jgi:hypothetical protein
MYKPSVVRLSPSKAITPRRTWEQWIKKWGTSDQLDDFLGDIRAAKRTHTRLRAWEEPKAIAARKQFEEERWLRAMFEIADAYHMRGDQNAHDAHGSRQIIANTAFDEAMKYLEHVGSNIIERASDEMLECIFWFFRIDVITGRYYNHNLITYPRQHQKSIKSLMVWLITSVWESYAGSRLSKYRKEGLELMLASGTSELFFTAVSWNSQKFDDRCLEFLSTLATAGEGYRSLDAALLGGSQAAIIHLFASKARELIAKEE